MLVLRYVDVCKIRTKLYAIRDLFALCDQSSVVSLQKRMLVVKKGVNCFQQGDMGSVISKDMFMP